MKTKKLIITLTDRTPQRMLSGTGAAIRYCNRIIPKSTGDVEMKPLKIIESIKNFLDVGVIIESLNNARKRTP